LEEKNLISRQQKGKRNVYVPKDPKATLRLIDQRREAMEEAIPELEALYKKQTHKPSIRFYEDFEEVKEIYIQTLKAENVYASGSIEKLNKKSPAFFNYYRKMLNKKKIIFKDLVGYYTDNENMQKTISLVGDLYDVRFMPKTLEEVGADILIWNDSVAWVILEEPIMGSVIESPHLAQTFKALFELAWKGGAVKNV
jgi:hypothetical protein